jgi:hypothetical protein
MKRRTINVWVLCALVSASGLSFAQDRPAVKSTAELHLRLVSSLPGSHSTVPAVVWLESLPGTDKLTFAPHGHYTLLQENRTFIPHLQVIPVGSVVDFPNADPFFHNVFSLFEGKRFDLGLYEAGSSRSVTFSHEGLSYIFCDIHPEMSAVVLALSTPLYSIAAADNSFAMRNIPLGDYRMRIWIEGVPKSVLDGLSRHLRLSSGPLDLGTLSAPISRQSNMTHSNKFGNPYDTHSHSPY